MHEALVENAGLVCPGCRRPSAQGMLKFPLATGDVFEKQDCFVIEGFLVCSNADCRRRYPILEGVPIVLRDIAGWWSFEKNALSRPKFSAPPVRDFFEALASNEVGRIADRSLLSTYHDLHYGSHDDFPGAIGEASNPRRFWETATRMIRTEGTDRYERAVDLGCSVGRGTFELARFSTLAVGIDTRLGPVSAAAAVQRTGGTRFERRIRGRMFEEVPVAYSAARNVLFLVADAIEPPFRAESFDCVVALNLLDNVRLPLVLIGQMDALLRPGGNLVLSSPYEWREDITEAAEWLETDETDAAQMVRRIIEGKLFPQMRLRYEVLDELKEVPWVLRHHARHWSVFVSHMLKARKRP